MKKSVQFLLVVVGIVTVPLAFLGGFHTASIKAERTLQLEADTLIYNDSIYDAQHYGKLLLYARQGNTTGLVERLEYFADASLLTAWASKSNAVLKAIPRGPWSELRQDRSTHPRDR